MMAAAQARITKLAATRAVHAAFRWIHLNELRMRQWQLLAIAIPAPPFGESRRAAFFLDRFRELGLEEPHIDAEGNVLAMAPAGHDTTQAQQPMPALLLSAHLDTVFPSGTDCAPREEGARIHAPGACDNSAGLTALLAIAAALRDAELKPACPIVFCANVGEEGEGDLRGMRFLFAGPPRRFGAMLALEGSGTGVVVHRALGSRRLRVTLRGPGGHSWADAAQPNPIFVLSQALATISKLDLPASPRTTLHCGTIDGGTSVNSVPERVTAGLDIRSVSELEIANTAAAVRRILETTAASHPGLSLEIETIGDRPAAELSPDSPLLASLRAVDRHLHIGTEHRVGSTDANLPLALGIDALALGTGGTAGGIHTLGEWYDPTGRELALRRILLHVLDTCSLIANGAFEQMVTAEPA